MPFEGEQKLISRGMTLAPANKDPALQLSIDAIVPAGISLGHRLICSGDEHGLLSEESAAFAKSILKRRQASGAARTVARELLERLGCAQKALPKSISGAPIWPDGFIGSLAHDSRVAIATVGKRCDVRALGIDIEPAELLPHDLLDIVATPREREKIADDPCGGRLLFAAKEAVYKAVNPIDHTFLGHHDIEIDLINRKAMVCNGRVVDLRFCVSTHIVVIAFLLAAPLFLPRD